MDLACSQIFIREQWKHGCINGSKVGFICHTIISLTSDVSQSSHADIAESKNAINFIHFEQYTLFTRPIQDEKSYLHVFYCILGVVFHNNMYHRFSSEHQKLNMQEIIKVCILCYIAGPLSDKMF